MFSILLITLTEEEQNRVLALWQENGAALVRYARNELEVPERQDEAEDIVSEAFERLMTHYECSVILLTFLWQLPRTKRSPEQQGHGTNSAYRRWCDRCGSSSAFLTLIMIHGKEIFSRLSIPSASGPVSLGLSLWFSRERCPFHYTIFFRQIGPALRQFAPASRQVTPAIGRRGILSLTPHMVFPKVPCG